MEKLTLDETWKRCLAMWRWIVRERKKRPDAEVSDLKCEWLRMRGYRSYPDCNCFFCEYTRTRADRGPRCHYMRYGCPGKLVSSVFECAAKSYDFVEKPAAFLRKLEALNRKRLAKRKGKR